MVKDLETEVQIGENWRVRELGHKPDWKGVPYALIDPSTVRHQTPNFFSQGTEVEIIDGPVESQQGLPYYLVQTQKRTEGYISLVHFKIMDRV